MKKTLLFFAIALMAFANSWAATATFDFATNGAALFGFSEPSSSSSTAGDITAESTATVDGVTLKVGISTTNTVNRLYLDYNGGVQLRVYSGPVTISAPAGKKVQSVVFTNTRWSAPTCSTGSFVQEASWAGDAASVKFDFGGQSRIDKIVVTYTDGSSDPGSDVTEINTFYNLGTTLADNTEFKFTGNAFVVYKNGKYNYVRNIDAEGYGYSALIFGDLNPSYEVGDYIPAGWKGKKTTYRSQTEITDVTGNTASTMQAEEDDAEPFDYSGYVGYFSEYPLEDYENDYCTFTAVNLSAVDDKGYFTISEEEYDEDDVAFTASLQGFNKFKVDFPTNVKDQLFDVTGLLVHYNEAVQFVPTEIVPTDTSMPLWKIWYYGEDGDEVIVSDTLFVVAATKANEIEANSKNFIYVTDNATQILDDTYADWGWVEWIDWSPDFIALDCGNNTELYNKVAAMKCIAPKTVSGTLMDNWTNPRLLLDAAPEELTDCKFPTLALRNLALSDTIYSNGHEVAYISGYYLQKDGKEFLAGNNGVDAELFQPIELDRRYIGDLALTNGNFYEVKAVVKQKEPWESDDEFAPAHAPAKKGAPAKMTKTAKKAAKKARRKMSMYADNYYENYLICPLEVKSAAILGDIDGNGEVNVSDVTALINKILGSASFSDAVCDVNGDGVVNVSDVTALINIILG
ncbi:MAG: dockerin type I repeat-containing protein [Muribaculaceae bacterium]|nr:dockerin type I repeat-containing protein [Muribaculaceae bacterium]